MKICCTLLWGGCGFYQRLKCRVYRWRFVTLDGSRHALFEISDDSDFNVPVRAGGSGRIRIGVRNCFGESSGYRAGSGEISFYTASCASELLIGDRNFINNNVSIGVVKQVTIGNDCLIGCSVSIADCDFHDLMPQTRHTSQGSKQPVHIGNNVWLGTGVTVLKGVTVGDNSVIGAMSVVTKTIPNDCVAAGNPARVIRSLR